MYLSNLPLRSSSALALTSCLAGIFSPFVLLLYLLHLSKMTSLSNSGLSSLSPALHQLAFMWFCLLILWSQLHHLFAKLQSLPRFLLLLYLHNLLCQAIFRRKALPKNILKFELNCYTSLVPVLQINVDGVILSSGAFRGVKDLLQDSSWGCCLILKPLTLTALPEDDAC